MPSWGTQLFGNTGHQAVPSRDLATPEGPGLGEEGARRAPGTTLGDGDATSTSAGAGLGHAGSPEAIGGRSGHRRALLSWCPRDRTVTAPPAPGVPSGMAGASPAAGPARRPPPAAAGHCGGAAPVGPWWAGGGAGAGPCRWRRGVRAGRGGGGGSPGTRCRGARACQRCRVLRGGGSAISVRLCPARVEDSVCPKNPSFVLCF